MNDRIFIESLLMLMLPLLLLCVIPVIWAILVRRHSASLLSDWITKATVEPTNGKLRHANLGPHTNTLR